MQQRSRLTWIKLGDANSKLFHLCANARRWKNYIPTLQFMDRKATAHEDKAAALHAHLFAHFRPPPSRQHTLNWEALHIASHDLSHLDDDLLESKI
jgi:hypothetical protein